MYIYIYRKEDGKEDLDILNNTSILDATINSLIETKYVYVYIYIYRKEDGKEDLDNLNNTSKLDATINP